MAARAGGAERRDGVSARRGGSVLLGRANVPGWVRRCCYALAGVVAVAAVVELVPVASRGGDSRPVLRRERAQAARLGAELRSSRQQLRLSQNQLPSSHDQLRSSQQRLESSQRQLRSSRQQLQWPQSQARSSRQPSAQARRAVVVARSQAAANGRTHASTSRAAMNVTLTLRQWPDEPVHRLALNVPAEMSLSELLWDFLDAVEEHAREHRLPFEDSEGPRRLRTARQVLEKRGRCKMLALTIADIEAGRIGPPTDGGRRGSCIWRDSRVVASPAELNRPPPSRRARECIGPVIPQRCV
jgi:hypothetical protein